MRSFPLRFGLFALLIFLLICTNAWWMWQSFSNAVTYMYRDVALTDECLMLEQLLNITKQGGLKVGRTELIEAAKSVAPHSIPFEVGGFLHIDRMGFKFDADGRLIEMRRGVGACYCCSGSGGVDRRRGDSETSHSNGLRTQ